MNTTTSPDQLLRGKRIAVLATDGFEQEELTSPISSLEEAGAVAEIVSLERGTIQGWKESHWGDEFDVDLTVSEANPEDYDALVLPGGAVNPESLRQDEGALDFIRRMADGGKIIGAICHGPWPLIDAGLVRGRRMTSFKSIQSDLQDAGAEWLDAEVVVDNGLVTSRRPDDLPAFNSRLIQEVALGNLLKRSRSTKAASDDVAEHATVTEHQPPLIRH